MSKKCIRSSVSEGAVILGLSFMLYTGNALASIHESLANISVDLLIPLNVACLYLQICTGSHFSYPGQSQLAYISCDRYSSRCTVGSGTRVPGLSPSRGYTCGYQFVAHVLFKYQIYIRNLLAYFLTSRKPSFAGLENAVIPDI